MATSNFYTGKMKVTTDTSTSGTKPKKKTNKKTTSKKKKAVKEDETNQDEDKPADEEDANEKVDSEEVGEEPDSASGSEEKKTGTLKDLIKDTETVITTSKVGTEPSGLTDDTVDNDKISVSIKNPNGTVNYILWVKPGTTPPKAEEAMKDVVKAIMKGSNVSDLDEFRHKFGFENVSEERATKAFDGFKRATGTMQKMFPEDKFDQLKQFCGEQLAESDITCEVKPEDDDKFGVYDENGLWLASFQTKEMAEEFSKQYPSLYKKYVES